MRPRLYSVAGAVCLAIAVVAQTGSPHTLSAHEKAERVAAWSQLPVPAALAKSVTLGPKVRLILPEGMDIPKAAAGFQDTGVFLATVHASQNLGVPFNHLKGYMTGQEKATLVAAIQQMRYDVDAKAEAKKASNQARGDLEAEVEANRETP